MILNMSERTAIALILLIWTVWAIATVQLEREADGYLVDSEEEKA